MNYDEVRRILREIAETNDVPEDNWRRKLAAEAIAHMGVPNQAYVPSFFMPGDIKYHTKPWQNITPAFTHKPGCPYMTAAGGTGQCTCKPFHYEGSAKVYHSYEAYAFDGEP